MSADNWTICPRCSEKEEARVKQLRLKAGESYGKVTPDEYLKLLEEANKPVKCEDTLREDYDIGVHKGVFTVSYRCSCEVCGLSYNFDFEKKVPVS